MKDILTEIIAYKRTEVAQQMQAVSLDQLRQQTDALAAEGREHRSMKCALVTSPSGIIAEFKRRSPSKGWIKQEAQVELIAPAYEAAGAAALSILTDEHFFGGNLRDLRQARPLVNIPILRKEFIIDEYQLLQARIVGADAVLLIASCLSVEACATLTRQAHELELEVLLEVHAAEEFAHINSDIDMVGINNRHLGTFVTDVQTSFILAEALRSHISKMNQDAPLLVSESGLSSAETLQTLRQAGFRGFLMGEAFMKSDDPGEALYQLINP